AFFFRSEPLRSRHFVGTSLRSRWVRGGIRGEATRRMDGSGDSTAPEPTEVQLLIAQYREDAFRLARHLVRSTAEAEDLAHTAILNVLRRAENISDADHVRPYLLTAVRNAWRNQLRSRGSRRFLGADYAESLSPTSRQIIELRYFEGLGFPELAQRLSITSVAARQRAHRAREELVGACMDHAAHAGEGECKPIRLRLGRYHRGLLSKK